MTRPFVIPELSDGVVGPMLRESAVVAGREFHWLRPALPERLLDLPSVEQAYNDDEYLPYWATIWPASLHMMTAVLQLPPHTASARALELGCGLGLAGIAALAAGWQVTFSDYDLTALRFASLNAALNGFNEVPVKALDWRSPLAETFHLIIASDVIYERRSINPLMRALAAMLAPDGTALIADPDRPHAAEFRRRLGEHGLAFTSVPWTARATGGDQTTGTLYRVYWPKAAL